MTLTREEILRLAVAKFNENIMNRPAVPKGTVLPGRFTIASPREPIRIDFHGYLLKYLSQESRDKLDFEHHDGREIRMHRHDYFEFTYLFSGSTTHHLMHQNSFRQKASQLVMMNRHAYHAPIIDSEETIMFNICINHEVIQSIFSSMQPFNQTFYRFFWDSLYGEGESRRILVYDITGEMEQVLFQMLETYYTGGDFVQQRLYALCILLLSYIARQQYLQETQNKEPLKDISLLLEYIRKNYATVSLKEIASRSGYSGAYITRMIKNDCGMTYRQYVAHCRLEHARNYLIHSGLSIEQICELTGYENAGSFFRKFKAETGVTPTQYRQMHITDNLNDTIAMPANAYN